MEVPAKIWILMSRCLSGEASLAEKTELQQVFRDYPDIEAQYQTLARLWIIEQNTSQESNKAGNVKRIFQRAAEERQQLPEEKQAGSGGNMVATLSRYGIAAMLLIALSLVYFRQKRQEKQAASVTEQVVTAQNGSRTRALLPDGSTVWLNAGSKLRFQPSFEGRSRDVILEGEAFFDVVKMPHKPFIVHLGAIDIKVLGTAFNVKSYREDEHIETTLLRGAVEIIPKNNQTEEHIFLKPNQKLVFAKDKKEPIKPKPDLEKIIVQGPAYQLEKIPDYLKENQREETAWIYNRIEFRGEDFNQLAEKLERWYNVEISFEDEQVKQLKFNGSFEKETVNQAFDALKKVASFDYKIKGREISIKSSH